jgi:hypothetical protein
VGHAILEHAFVRALFLALVLALFLEIFDARSFLSFRDHSSPHAAEEAHMADVQPGRYRHYKGNEYTVLGLARHSETLEDHVVYRQEYGDHGLWVRPAAMFAESVVVDGKTVPRFAILRAEQAKRG